jgi:hypothetical protein
MIVMRVIACENKALRATTPSRVSAGFIIFQYHIPVRSRIWYHVDVFRPPCVSLESPVITTDGCRHPDIELSSHRASPSKLLDAVQ